MRQKAASRVYDLGLSAVVSLQALKRVPIHKTYRQKYPFGKLDNANAALPGQGSESQPGPR